MIKFIIGLLAGIASRCRGFSGPVHGTQTVTLPISHGARNPFLDLNSGVIEKSNKWTLALHIKTQIDHMENRTKPEG